MRNGFFDDYRKIEKLSFRLELNSIVLLTFGGIKTPRHADIKGVIVGIGLDTRREDILAGLAWGVSLNVALIVRDIKRYARSPKEPV